MKNLDLKNKVVLISGGTSGIGLETAKKFLIREAQVIITGRDIVKAKKISAGLSQIGPVTFFNVNLEEPSEIENMFKDISEKFGRLDIAVNNAADSSGVGKLLHEFTLDEFNQAISQHLRGYWCFMKQEINLMLSQSPSVCSIVNVSSVNGLGGAPGGALYSAAKAGVLALTKSAAYELASSGIRVNAIVPGANKTPLLEKILSGQAKTDEQNEAVESMYRKMIPMGRFADPEETAEAILWLSSSASSYVTGHSLIVDGGTSCLYR